ncbi:unnamed protein product [Ectocarpus sp. 4 AP-2014]
MFDVQSNPRGRYNSSQATCYPQDIHLHTRTKAANFKCQASVSRAWCVFHQCQAKALPAPLHRGILNTKVLKYLPLLLLCDVEKNYPAPPVSERLRHRKASSQLLIPTNTFLALHRPAICEGELLSRPYYQRVPESVERNCTTYVSIASAVVLRLTYSFFQKYIKSECA